MTRSAVKSWVCVSGLLLACSGRFEVGVNDMAAGAPNGGKASMMSGEAGREPTPGTGASMTVGGSMAVDGSMAVGGSSVDPGMSTDAVGNVRSSACGVPPGQPEPLMEPIRSLALRWWSRMAQLVWGEVREAPMDLPSSIDYAQAGELADAEIDRAIEETGGIPGADGFVRWWLGLDDRYDDALTVDWSKQLRGAAPAPTVLLTSVHDATRRGAFTEPGFLKTYPTISSRGYVMTESIMGVLVPDEPKGIVHVPAPDGVARRDFHAKSLSDPACIGCHSVFDPFGFSLLNYDTLGEYTTEDGGKPVDASGTLGAFYTGDSVSFMSYVDLGPQLHERCDVNLVFADRFLVYALTVSNVPVATLDAHTEDRARVQQAFIRSNRSYRSLIKAFVLSRAGRDFQVGAK